MPNPEGGVRTSLTETAGLIATNRFNIGNVVFSPGTPIQPTNPQPVRGFDFPVNVNANIRPRAYESLTFAHLRAFSNVELVRMAIETRKDQIERQQWAIKPRDNKASVDSRCKTVTQFFEKPDGVTTFAGFIRPLIEDLLALDAPCVELRRTRGGKLIGLEYVPGETIVPKVDETGRVPRDPDALAYQQVIKGVVWNDLTRRDILYMPRNITGGKVYGRSPVETIITTINTIIRRQAMQLAHFTAGNVPAGLINGPDGWQLDKLSELQDWLDDKVGGLQSEQQKLLFVPSGAKYQALKDAPIKDEFDEWLARIVAYAFSLPPTPFVRQMNKSTAGEDQDRALEEGLEPIKLWVKRWVDGVLATEFDAPDLEFMFLETPTIDVAVQNVTEDKNLRNGTATIDEIRDARGLDPLPDGLGAEPLIYTAQGAVRLRDVLEPPEPVEVPAAAPSAPQGAPQAQQQAKPDKGSKDEAAAAESAAKAVVVEVVAPNPALADMIAKAKAKGHPKPITIERKKARTAIASIHKSVAKVLREAANDVAAQAADKLAGIAKDATDPSNSPRITAALIAAKIDLSALDGLGSAMEDDLAELGADSGTLALSAVGDARADESMFDRVFDRAVDYAKARAAELVSVDGDESLITSTRDMIRGVIANGLADNIGAEEIAKNIADSTAFSDDRADLIATTEVAMANENGKMAAWQEAQDAGIELVKAWLVSNDEGTCDECEGNEADGEIPLDEPFSSGDDTAPAHPGCRCATSAHSIDSNGNEADQEED